jgi:hypothetical protein
MSVEGKNFDIVWRKCIGGTMKHAWVLRHAFDNLTALCNDQLIETKGFTLATTKKCKKCLKLINSKST